MCLSAALECCPCLSEVGALGPEDGPQDRAWLKEGSYRLVVAWDPAVCCLQADPKLWETLEAQEAARMAYRPYTAPTASMPASPSPPSAATISALQQAAPKQQTMPQPSCPEHDPAAALDCPVVLPAVWPPATPVVGSDSCATARPGSAAAAKEIKTALPKKGLLQEVSTAPSYTWSAVAESLSPICSASLWQHVCQQCL